MATSSTLKVLGLSGSLRRASLNTALLLAAKELAPAGMVIEVFDLSPIPLYSEDVRQAGMPESVVALRTRIAEADAVLIATPEYNYSVPGVLKNAIDWASRPPDQPFDAKPVAIMGASPARLGTSRAQYHLRQVFVYLNAWPINKPEVMLGGARSLFDDSGRLTDATARGQVADLLAALAAHVGNLVRKG